MKEKLIQLLELQKQNGDDLLKNIDDIASSTELDDFFIEYNKWDNQNCNILKNGYEGQTLYRIYSAVRELKNVYDDENTFKGKRSALLNWLPKQLAHLSTAINTTRTLKNTQLLPLDEIPTPSTKSQILMKKLFISHASLDQDTTKPLIDLIEGIGVPHKQIFYSSHAAYGVGLGEDIFQRLKKELEGDILALFMLSENFYKSPVCLCEMGAVWIKSNRQIPILIPPFGFSVVKGVFPYSLGFKMNDKQQLASFKEQIEDYFDLEPIHLSRWEDKRDEYLEKIDSKIS